MKLRLDKMWGEKAAGLKPTARTCLSLLKQAGSVLEYICGVIVID
jgi:hypothetical protein